jgi:hypothetical protein
MFPGSVTLNPAGFATVGQRFTRKEGACEVGTPGGDDQGYVWMESGGRAMEPGGSQTGIGPDMGDVSVLGRGSVQPTSPSGVEQTRRRSCGRHMLGVSYEGR